MQTISEERRRAVQLLGGILLFALLSRISVGLLYYSTFDIEWYRTWALDLQNGFFDCYARLTEGKYQLDYPPAYLFLLYLLGRLYQLLGLQDYVMYDMIAMKAYPILFDVLTAGLLYFVCRRESEKLGVLAAALWALNPSSFFNCSNWGQTDCIMLFLLVVAFYQAERRRPFTASILFAVACLTKMQTLYFTPVLFLFLLRRYRLPKTMACVGAAFATGITAFIPFIIGGWGLQGWESLLTPFRVYLGGLGKYPYAALNTYNIYGIFNLNWVWDGLSIIGGTVDPKQGFAVGGFTLQHLSLLLTMGSLALLCWVMLKGRRKHSLWLGGYLFMQCIFMLTTRMHERYEIAVLPFALLLFLRLRDFRWLWQYILLSAVTFINQFMLLVRNNTVNDPGAPWSAIFEPVQAVMSGLNLLLFLWGLWLTWRTAFPSALPHRKTDVKGSEPQEAPSSPGEVSAQ